MGRIKDDNCAAKGQKKEEDAMIEGTLKQMIERQEKDDEVSGSAHIYGEKNKLEKSKIEWNL
jgi:hypothetical protein